MADRIGEMIDGQTSVGETDNGQTKDRGWKKKERQIEEDFNVSIVKLSCSTAKCSVTVSWTCLLIENTVVTGNFPNNRPQKEDKWKWKVVLSDDRHCSDAAGLR